MIVCVIQNFFFTLAHAIKEDYLETCLLEDYLKCAFCFSTLLKGESLFCGMLVPRKPLY